MIRHRQARVMQFLPDGQVKPLTHSNEARWRLEHGKLLLLTDGGVVSSILSSVTATSQAHELRGAYLLEPEANIRFVLRRFDWNSHPHPASETRGFLAAHMRERGWRIGAHSYGLPTVIEDRWADLHIGAFTSIAAGVVIALGNHRTDSVTTYPFASVDCLWPSVPDTPDHSSRGDVVIGSDVWIGVDAFIGSGVTIGDGAVIGAHAVVTRDVPPFAIVSAATPRVSSATASRRRKSRRFWPFAGGTGRTRPSIVTCRLSRQTISTRSSRRHRRNPWT